MAGIPHRRPRLDDVAAKVGVSTGTVSLVLSNAPGPSAATRERVMAAAAELGYRPDRTASLLARRRAHLLGVMLDVRSTFHAELVAELHDAAEAAGYDVLLSTVTPTRDARRAIETLRRLAVRGVGAPRAGRPDRAADHARRADPRGRRGPEAALARPSTWCAPPTTHGVTAAVEHLVELGHRDIAFVDGGSGDHRQRPSCAATCGRCAAHGLEDRVRVLAGGPDRGGRDLGRAGGWPAATTRPPRWSPTTTGSRSACSTAWLRAGVAVPEEVSVVGYDDSPSAQLPHVDLTTVSQDTRRAGRERRAGRRRTPRRWRARRRGRSCSSPASSYVGPRRRRGQAQRLTRSAVNGAAARSTAP